MRKYTALLVVLAAALAVALTPGVASANFSIHGGYSMDTDACAGCHRAHTAASSITWTDSTSTEQSALLNSTADEIYEFCYTCHDAVSLGAETNVEEGIYEGTDYGTLNDELNGGGFEPSMGFTASHIIAGSWFAYGGGITTDLLGQYSDLSAPQIEMTCSTCHDVHGSSNYRLLKDIVNGYTVGGYDGSVDPVNPVPLPWVVSAEPGYPGMGWLLHEPGASQVSTYTPDYTDPMYAKAPDRDGDGDPDTDKGMSGWCAACHTQYLQDTGAVYAGTGYDATDMSSLTASETLGYNSLDGWGAAVRHRHPVNVELANFAGVRSLVLTDNPLPLAHDPAAVDSDGSGAINDGDDWIDCLTCHVAHGSKATMEGYANVADSTDPLPDSGTGGIPPAGDNALLRLNNRGVCEVCHNK